MKNKIFLLATIAAAALTAGCTKQGTEIPTGPVALRSIGVEVANARTRAVYGADPTMSNVAARAAQGHVLTVGIDGQDTPYKYENGKWVPDGSAASFPGYGTSTVSLTLAKEGAVQDGSAEGLLDADVLTYSAELSPAAEIYGAELSHARTLIQVQLDGELVIDEGTPILIGSGSQVADYAVSYAVPGSKNHAAVIDAGVEGFNVRVTKDGVDYYIYIGKEEVVGEAFKANYRYTVVLTGTGTAVGLKIVILEEWTETGSGIALESIESKIDLGAEYVKGTAVKVKLDSGAESTLDFNDTANPSVGSVYGLEGQLIHSIRVGTNPEILIGRALGEDITLALTADGAAVTLRQEGGSYLVGTIAEFALIDDTDLNAASFLQEADIHMMNTAWEPLFKYNPSEPGSSNSFKGTFDGNGKKIHDIFHGEGGYAALFSGNDGGTIENVHIASGKIGHKNYTVVAGICAYNVSGTIQNCINGANIEAGYLVGGICSMNNGLIVDCENRGAISTLVREEGTGRGYTGGIVALNGNFDTGARIENCTNNGTIDGVFQCNGGIAGYSLYGVIKGCTNNGAVNGGLGEGSLIGLAPDGYRTGGIVGYCINLVEECTNNGAVTASGLCGGIVGHGEADANNNDIRIDIRKCTNNGVVTATNAHAGGIVSAKRVGSVTDCLNTGYVYARAGDAGGIVGYNNSGAITACKNTGMVKGETSDYAMGGIAGNNEGPVTACYNLNINRSEGIFGPKDVGGICGKNYGVLRACFSVSYINSAGATKGEIIGINYIHPVTEAHGQALECYGYGSALGAPLVGQNNADAEDVVVYTFSPTTWPADDAAKCWGIGADYAAGRYWGSLGTSGTMNFPKLNWEE